MHAGLSSISSLGPPSISGSALQRGPSATDPSPGGSLPAGGDDFESAFEPAQDASSSFCALPQHTAGGAFTVSPSVGGSEFASAMGDPDLLDSVNVPHTHGGKHARAHTQHPADASVRVWWRSGDAYDADISGDPHMHAHKLKDKDTCMSTRETGEEGGVLGQLGDGCDTSTHGTGTVDAAPPCMFLGETLTSVDGEPMRSSSVGSSAAADGGRAARPRSARAAAAVAGEVRGLVDGAVAMDWGLVRSATTTEETSRLLLGPGASGNGAGKGS